jgi:hypothetical protein
MFEVGLVDAATADLLPAHLPARRMMYNSAHRGVKTRG